MCQPSCQCVHFLPPPLPWLGLAVLCDGFVSARGEGGWRRVLCAPAGSFNMSSINENPEVEGYDEGYEDSEEEEESWSDETLSSDMRPRRSSEGSPSPPHFERSPIGSPGPFSPLSGEGEEEEEAGDDVDPEEEEAAGAPDPVIEPDAEPEPGPLPKRARLQGPAHQAPSQAASSGQAPRPQGPSQAASSGQGPAGRASPTLATDVVDVSSGSE